MSYISALTDYLNYKKIIAKPFREEIDLGCNRTIHSVFFNENEILCIGIEDCGFLFTEDITENYAEMIIDHLLETEGIYIPIDE
jgi:hypothetical protein